MMSLSRKEPICTPELPNGSKIPSCTFLLLLFRENYFPSFYEGLDGV